MKITFLRNPSAHLAQTGAAFGVAMVVFIAYSMPLIGFLASLCLPFATHTLRRYLWPEASNAHSMSWSVLAWAGLWLPGLVGIFTSAFNDAGVDISTTWLIIPLCAPTGISTVLVPALAAAVTCLVGLLAAAKTRRGWLWVVAAWLTPWVHYLVFSELPHEFFC